MTIFANELTNEVFELVMFWLSLCRNKNGISRVVMNGRTVDIQYTLKRSQLELINPKTIATGIYQCEVNVKNGIVTMTRYVHFRGESDFFYIEFYFNVHRRNLI